MSVKLVKGAWFIQASSFDEQILVFLRHEITRKSYFKMFYSEEKAYKFISKLEQSYTS
tara:strand:- start:3917 stop:4090 length:174 start_codon:yes stop_codon:yes gene_type:complete